MIDTRYVHLFESFAPDAVLQRLIWSRCEVCFTEPEYLLQILVLMRSGGSRKDPNGPFSGLKIQRLTANRGYKLSQSHHGHGMGGVRNTCRNRICVVKTSFFFFSKGEKGCSPTCGSVHHAGPCEVPLSPWTLKIKYRKPKIDDPKPQPANTKHQTSDTKHKTLNTKHQKHTKIKKTPNPSPIISNPKPQTPWHHTPNTKHQTPNTKYQISNAKHSTLKSKHSTLITQH